MADYFQRVTRSLKRQRRGVVLPFAKVAEATSPLPDMYWLKGWDYTRAEPGGPALGVNTIYTAPMQIAAGTNFDAVGVSMYYASATGVLKFAIYEEDQFAGGPGRLVANLGTITGPAAGFNSVSCNVTIHKSGVYYLAVKGEVIAMTVVGRYGWGMFAGANTTSHYMNWGYALTYATSGFPDPMPTVGQAALGPILLLRVNYAPQQDQSDRGVNIGRAYPKAGENVIEGHRFQVANPTMTVAQNDLILTPMCFQKATPVNFFGASGVTSTGSLLIYDNGPQNYPNKLIYRKDFTAATFSDNTIRQVFQPGIYWVGMHNTGDQLTGVSGPNADAHLQFAVTPGTNYPSNGMKISTASVPDPFSGTPADSVQVPKIYFQSNDATKGPSGLWHRSHHHKITPVYFHLMHKGWWVGPTMVAATTYDTKVPLGSNYHADILILDKKLSFNQVGFEIRTWNQNDTYTFGLYDDLNWKPNNMLYNFGSVVATSAGTWTIAIDITLKPGVYWVAFASASASLNEIYDRQAWAMFMGAGGAIVNPRTSWAGSGALPTPTWPRNCSVSGGLAVFLRVKS